MQRAGGTVHNQQTRHADVFFVSTVLLLTHSDTDSTRLDEEARLTHSDTDLIQRDKDDRLIHSDEDSLQRDEKDQHIQCKTDSIQLNEKDRDFSDFIKALRSDVITPGSPAYYERLKSSVLTTSNKLV